MDLRKADAALRALGYRDTAPKQDHARLWTVESGAGDEIFAFSRHYRNGAAGAGDAIEIVMVFDDPALPVAAIRRTSSLGTARPVDAILADAFGTPGPHCKLTPFGTVTAGLALSADGGRFEGGLSALDCAGRDPLSAGDAERADWRDRLATNSYPARALRVTSAETPVAADGTIGRVSIGLYDHAALLGARDRARSMRVASRQGRARTAHVPCHRDGGAVSVASARAAWLCSAAKESRPCRSICGLPSPLPMPSCWSFPAPRSCWCCPMR